MKIVYATDGSQGAKDAGQVLAALPHRDDATVHIITIPASHLDEDEDAARERLTEAAHILGETFPAGQVITEIGPSAATNGETAERIVERATDLDADLLVVGTHGRPTVTRWFLGSVALNATRHAPCPVLVARHPHGAVSRVLVGVDGSACSEQAVRWMLERLPFLPGAGVHLLCVVTFPGLAWGGAAGGFPVAQEAARMLEEEGERLRGVLNRLAAEVRAKSSGWEVTTEVRVGSAAGDLIAAAERWQADLVVLGSHGYGTVDRWLLGSVSEAVLLRAPCSVLIVR